jgi:hypothetical protein
MQGTKRDAEKKLTELLHDLHRSQFVEPSMLSVSDWLNDWLETAIKPPNKRLRTSQRRSIRWRLIPALARGSSAG